MEGRWLRKASSGKPTFVFVHGVISNGDDCWRNKNGSYWPKIVADDPELEGYGIWVFTYLTGITSGSFSVSDAATSLRTHLLFENIFPNNGIIFVCHSMGGIVVRKFITTNALDISHARAKIGLLLVASPSLGSGYATLITPLIRLFGHAQGEILRASGNCSGGWH